MKNLKKVIKLLCNSNYRFNILANYGFFNHWSDEKFLKHKFKLIFGHELNLDNPQTFNEKLQWLKLYDRNPIYSIMVDKYKAKEYIAKTIGSEYVIPTLGVWDNPRDIDFDRLPNRFVLKCNHNSGLGMYICKDKNKLNIKKIRKNLAKGLRQNYYLTNREWPYKNVPRKVLAEQFLEDKHSDCLTDYKFFCFNGIPRFMYMSQDFSATPHTDFFDMDRQPLSLRMKDPNSPIVPTLPAEFEKMKELATALSAGTIHLRVDFYLVNNQIYVGELTFFHNAGFTKFVPDSWDEIWGKHITLPSK